MKIVSSIVFFYNVEILLKKTELGYENGIDVKNIDELTTFYFLALQTNLDHLGSNTDLELDQSTLKRIEDISKMSNDDRSFVLRAIDALIRDFKAQKTYAS